MAKLKFRYLHGLEMLLQDLCGLATAPGVDPPCRVLDKFFSQIIVFCTLTLPADVVEGLWRGYDVERRGDGAALLEVGDPQLGARELPLGVRLLLGGQSLALDQDQPEPTRHEICKR